MMRMQPATITLGSRQWQVRPLTLAQVQTIEPLVFGSAEAKAGSVAAAIAILRVALTRDHADAVDALDEVEAGAPEIAAAMAQVLRLGGFLPPHPTLPPSPIPPPSPTPPRSPISKGDVASGEAGAGLPPASTGRDSTPA